MTRFYIMYASTCNEDYVSIDGDLTELDRGCIWSEFQFLDHESITVNLDENGGDIFPDFILHRGFIPLISQKFRDVFDTLGVDNLFYKQIWLDFEAIGWHQEYWLALPPRIECIDEARSVIREAPEAESVVGTDWPAGDSVDVLEIVILPEAVGHYKIFKLPKRCVNQDIIVTEEVKMAIEHARLKNVWFAPVKEE